MMKNFTRLLILILGCLACFGSQAQTCPGSLGPTVNIASLPYNGTNLTTCGAGNEITATNATICGSSSYYGGEDQVFIFTPTSSGSIIISLTSTSSWIGMMLYNGCPFLGQGGSCVGNVQSSAGSKTLTVTVTSGVTYYLVVDTWPTPTCIPLYSLSIPAPAGGGGDPCSSITTLACATPATVTLSGSGVWNNSTCLFSTPGQEKVYSFTPTSTGVHSLQVTSATGTGYIDYQYKAASGGCSSTGWTCIDDINFTTTVTIGTLTAGVQYYILLDAETTTSSTQTFQINCPTAPDPCASITTLACATSATATLSGTGSWSNLTCGFSTPGQEKIYSFTPTTTGAHSLQVTSSSGSYIDYMYKAASGGCSSTGWTCIDDISITGTYPIGTLTAGVQYYILLDPESTSSVTHSFQIVCPAAPDPCASITTLACATPATATLSGSGVWNTSFCGFTVSGQEKVYSFTPTVTGVHNLQVTSTSGSYIDYAFKAASGGCSSTGWTCIDDISIPLTVAIGTLTAGVQYYILLDAESTGSVTHTFQINCPAAFDPCSSITALTCGTAVTATPSGTGLWDVTICGFSTPGQERVYSFTPTVTGAHSLQVNSVSGGYIDYFYKAASGGCNSSGWTCIDDINFTGTFPIGTLTAGVQYYILLDPEATGAYSHNFQIVCPSPVPSCLASPTSPANGAALCLPGPGTLSWPSASGATSYDVYFGTSPTPPFFANTASTSISIGSQPKGTYYWQIRPANGAGTASGCPIWSFTIDITPPTIFGCPNNQAVLRNASCVATLPDYTVAPSTGDNCPGPVTVSQSPAPGTVLNGTVTVTLTATDAAGNTATCSFTATPVDLTPPMISNCPNNQAVLRNASCVATLPDYTVVPTTGDNCPGTITLAQAPAPGTVLSGTVTVTLTVTDAAGNTATCSFTATPVDQTPPTLANCPGNQTASVDANCQGVLANYTGGVMASDNCPGVGAVSQSPPPGSIFTGTTIVTLSATDASGNTGTCTFSVQVADNTPPMITCTVGTLNPAANASCQYVVQNLTSFSMSSDNCGTPTLSQTPTVGTTLGLGTSILVLRATDANGNSSTCTITLSVTDQTAPTITCPATQTVAANATCQASLADYTGMGAASDNCTANPAKLQTPSPGTMLGLGSITVTLRATDGVGLTGTCTFTVSVTDQTAPTITCPGTQTVAANASCQASLADYTGLGAASDNCTANPAKLQTPSPGTTLGLGSTTVTLRATDGVGLTGTCTFTVSVTDQTAPTITCPGTQTVAANATCQASLADYTGLGAASDNCTANPAKLQTPSPGTTLGLGSTTVTLRATDGAGLTGTCTFTVSVTDQTPPTITCPGTQTVAANASCQASLADYTGLGAASDNCTANPAKLQTPSPGTILGLGSTTVTLRATDGVGLTGTCTFTVSVTDQTPPTITCPANINLNNNLNVCGATVTYTVTSSDNCAGSSSTLTLLNGQASGTIFPVGTTTVIYRATDPSNNSSTCSFTITVIDVTLPAITCPANIVVNNSPATACSAVVTYATPSASDNCAIASTVLIGGLASGSVFPVGTTTNVWRATDVNGNTNTCSFTVTVNDVTLPTITCPPNIVGNNDPGVCGAVRTYSTPAASDNCGIQSVTLLSGLPSGSLFPVGTTTNIWRATDVNGNTNTCSFTVKINDVEPPVVTCPPPVNKPNDAGQCSRFISNLGNATVADNCVPVSLVNNSPGTFPVGTTWVTYTLTDNSGNTGTCIQSVTVYDQEYPGIICPSTIVALTDENDCIATVDYTLVAADDNCGAYTVAYDIPPLSTFDIGYTAVTATITDASGNSSSCTFLVNVNTRKEICNDYDDDCDGLTDEAEDWVKVAKRLAKGGGAFDEYGISVDIDGDWAIVGSNKKNSNGQTIGAAYLLRRSTTTPDKWIGVMSLTPDQVAAGDQFGASVAIDGNTAAIGAPSDDEAAANAGAVWIFKQSATNPNLWVQVKKVKAGDAAQGDNFGAAIAMDNGQLLAGAPLRDGSGANAGGAYLFDRNQGGPDEWGQIAQMLAPAADADDNLGASVALDGGNALVGAPGDDDKGPDAGAAYLFQGSALVKKMLGIQTMGGDQFGKSVSISGAYAVVGAPNNDLHGPDAGAAFSFCQNCGGANNWGQYALFSNNFSQAGDHFGAGVALEGDYAVITAPGDDPYGEDSGQGYIYLRVNQGWAPITPIADGGGGPNDGFGTSVALSGHTALVGSPFDQTGNDASRGSVLFFEGVCAEVGQRGEATEKTAPAHAGLDVQCRPVPFSDALTVQVNTGATDLRVVVFNSLGQEMAVLQQGATPGLFQWQAGNAQPGIYFIRVQAGGLVQTQSVVLARP